jgi:hypothetical protein
MRWLLIFGALVVGCDIEEGIDPPPPDAGPPCVAAEADYCEAINQPPDCWNVPCSCAEHERVCDNEKVCGYWEDCYQCRSRFYCSCEEP